ncbi:MAG: hypothetical protein A2X23_05425 [Chloroflexi bacterium GWC2_73_18]|nr:MAG: hypothetical protein A2X23_05425 [Chloroflexi bacterium GWC2_73_18]
MTSERASLHDRPGACPFVAYEDDRDLRSPVPDHRHRCFAEVRPAPRALAHQEAYCLASAFPACPTFQDWARREAARALPAERPEAARVEEAPPAPPGRDWTAPPPWLARESSSEGLWAGAEAETGRPGGTPPGPPAEPPSPVAPASETAEEDEDQGELPPFLAGREDDEEGLDPYAPRHGDLARSGRRPVAGGRGAAQFARPDGAPPWERPRRYESYPSLRSRVGLPAIPHLAIYAAALVIAAVALFFLPTFFSDFVSGDRPTPSPTPLPSASASQRPTPTSAPTAAVYVVKAGDTLSGIADTLGVTLQQLLAANPQISDPDKIKIGDKIYIPGTGPVPVPSPSPGEGSPGPSASPPAETPLP